MKRYIAALDQGTTSSRCILFDQDQNILGTAQRELTQIYPQPGWVEQDPMEIWSTQYSVLTEVLDTGGVYLVPAFTGLGAPYWDMYARGALVGLTRGTGRDHIIRAAQESIAYQSWDLVHAMEKDTGIPLTQLKVDGGASRDRFLMQFQADILDKPVRRPVIRETTALGAAYLAGLAVGMWSGLEEIRAQWRLDRLYEPDMGTDDGPPAGRLAQGGGPRPPLG